MCHLDRRDVKQNTGRRDLTRQPPMCAFPAIRTTESLEPIAQGYHSALGLLAITGKSRPRPPASLHLLYSTWNFSDPDKASRQQGTNSDQKCPRAMFCIRRLKVQKGLLSIYVPRRKKIKNKTNTSTSARSRAKTPPASTGRTTGGSPKMNMPGSFSSIYIPSHRSHRSLSGFQKRRYPIVPAANNLSPRTTPCPGGIYS